MRCDAIGPYNHRVEGSDNGPVNGSNSSNRTVEVFLSVVIPTLVTVVEGFLLDGLVLVMFPMVMFSMVVLVMVMFPMGLR